MPLELSYKETSISVHVTDQGLLL